MQENDPEKLLRLPARVVQGKATSGILPALENALAERRAQILQTAALRKIEILDQEDQRLDDWADDLKNGLEKEMKNTEQEIKEVKRTIRSLVSMEEKAVWIKKKTELTKKYNRQKREFLSEQDKIEQQRDELMAEYDAQMAQKISEETLFLIEWEMV